MMMHPKNIHGLRVPLFDRLVDSDPEVQKELTALRVEGVRLFSLQSPGTFSVS